MLAPEAPELRGARVVLRPVRETDIEALERVPVDPGIVRMYGGVLERVRPRSRKDAEHAIRRLESEPHTWAIDVGGCIGHVRLDHLNSVDRRASLAIGIDDATKLGQGLGTEAIRLVAAHAFGSMGLHRLTLRVLAYNARAIRAYEACGFVQEGLERQSACVGDVWYDDVMIGLLAAEFHSAIESI